MKNLYYIFYKKRLILALFTILFMVIPCWGQVPGPIDVTKYTIDDDEDQWADDHSEGDGDGVVEQGETIRLDIFLKNNGTAAATDVQATISTSSAWISITKETRTYEDIDAGEEMGSAGTWRNGFYFTVANDAASGDVTFDVQITTGNAGSYNDNVVVTIEGGGAPGPIRVSDFSIDDDDEQWADDDSQGDGDGISEQGEYIRMPVTLINNGSAPAFAVDVRLRSSSNNVVIKDSTSNYGVIGDSDVKSNAGTWRDGFYFRVPSTAESEDVVFVLQINTLNVGTFTDSIIVSVIGGGIVGPVEVTGFEIDDDANRWADDRSNGNDDGIINEDETIRMPMTLINSGTATAIDVSATLTTTDPLITITEDTKNFGSIGAGEEKSNAGIWRDGFHFELASSIPHKNVRFDLAISTSDGYTFSDSIIVAIGTETDQSSPRMVFISPTEAKTVPVRRFPIEATYHDGMYGSGINSNSFRISNDKDIGSQGTNIPAGTDISEYFAISDSAATLVVPDNLEFPLGENTLTASVEDVVGNAGQTTVTFTTSYYGLLNAEDGSYVNTSPFELQGFAVTEYVEKVEVNGNSVTINNDQFIFSVNLVEGANVVEVKAYDMSMALMGTEQFTIHFDNVPPVLAVDSPSEGAILQYSPVTVTGTASDSSPFRILVNGDQVGIEEGAFEKEVEIDEGSNSIVISAVDTAGNNNQVSLKVTGQAPSSPSGRTTLYLKDEPKMSQLSFPPYPSNTWGWSASYVTSTWVYRLNDDFNGTNYKISLLVGCYGLGSAIMQAQVILRHNGEDLVLATSDTITGSMAGPVSFWPYYMGPSRITQQFTGIDPDAVSGDSLIFTVKQIGGDRMGMVFIREADRGHSYLEIPEITVFVDEDQKPDIPMSFALAKNYPNPFNSTTTIGYQLPKDSKMTLRIYNSLGQLVLTLVDEEKSAGFHVVQWDGKDQYGKNVATGLYFYHLKIKDFSQTKKMILLQ